MSDARSSTGSDGDDDASSRQPASDVAARAMSCRDWMDALQSEDPERRDQAAGEIVRRYEPEIRRFIRFRLTSPHLRRIVESTDISQSVFRRFFVHVQKGEVSVGSSDDVRRLLLTMARNRLTDAARHENAEKRQGRRLVGDSSATLATLAAAIDTPSMNVSADELMTLVRSQLDERETELIFARLGGASWSELGEQAEASPDAVRKQVSRAIERVANRLSDSDET